ncbi:MAG: methyltransferase MtaB domain-containing protein [Clostridia bacterium]|jgi:methanol--5-hydroxybenzimidazolylcobamide Co-methyltransferase
MVTRFKQLSYENLNDFIFGSARTPVTFKNGMVIGGGFVYPELNFTLPTMLITKDSMPEVIKEYKSIVDDACKRAKELYSSGIVVEVELMPPTTYNPLWGIEITKVVRDIMYEYEAKHGLKSVLRITPVDIREDKHSPHMWHGSHWDAIMETFQGCAKAGAELLSIESIGGKNLHDEAIMYCEIDKSLFSLGILGAKDMARLWKEIKGIADDTGTIPAGDTACGFANTAMVLANKGYIPKVFAAVVRVISSVRSMIAIEEGAKGPHKDCGYEGVYVKAITGIPISAEGKSSACAHLSPVGNIAACVADLWSNESVQNVKLLGGPAPTVSMEQLIYDCRLMNKATETGKQNALLLRDLFCESDSKYDPQAYVLRPDVVIDISKEIIKEDTPFMRSKVAGLAAVKALRKAIYENKLIVDSKEIAWLDTMESRLEEVPDDEEAFVYEMMEKDFSGKMNPEKYDLKTR